MLRKIWPESAGWWRRTARPRHRRDGHGVAVGASASQNRKSVPAGAPREAHAVYGVEPPQNCAKNAAYQILPALSARLPCPTDRTDEFPPVRAGGELRRTTIPEPTRPEHARCCCQRLVHFAPPRPRSEVRPRQKRHVDEQARGRRCLEVPWAGRELSRGAARRRQ